MANTTFSGPVTSDNGFIGDIVVPTYTVANAPSASDAGAGTVVFVSNGAAGSQQSWLSLTAPTGSVLTLAALSQHRKEVSYEQSI
jgi:predicted neuraminidase